ncbi:MAG: carboxypeptidase-like regulatory domain-containing protein [Planctomycetaceae bacterium]|nr:carboxypeptidase-like regulatory domain-containing protein [Planctomycetaceae bacterium]
MKHCYFLLILCLAAGCGGPSVPPGFPAKLTPTTVLLLKDGQAIDGVAISLIPEVPVPFIVGAVTDKNGTATLETTVNSYTKKGVPAGTYKVLLLKQIDVPQDDMLPWEITELSESERKARELKRQKIEKEALEKTGLLPHWNDVNKTPFRWTVSDKGGDFKVEVNDPKTFVQ